jgi:hypothetical protein
MVVVIKSIEDGSLHKELEKIYKNINASKRKRSWNKFFGKVKSIKCPIEYQRNLRA